MSELKTLSQLDSQCLKKCSFGLEFCFNHQIACMDNGSTSIAHWLTHNITYFSYISKQFRLDYIFCKSVDECVSSNS